MKFLPILAIVLIVHYSDAGTLSCSSSSSSAASRYYCTPADNTSTSACSQCAAGVKYWCPTNPLLSTRSWKKGIKVLDNCNSIPRYTAIATFPNGGYSGHAAVFISCSGTSIQVYDQWNGKTWGSRNIWNTAGSISNNPNYFYTVIV